MIDLNRQLERWLQDGIINEEQAVLMQHSVAMPTRHSASDEGSVRRIPLVTEILGYVGAALAIWAVLFLAIEFWEDLGDLTHAGLFGLLSVVLFAAGFALLDSHEPAVRRLSGVLWSGSVVALGGMLFIVFDSLARYEVAFTWTLIGLLTAVASGFMLRRQVSTAQHLTLFAAALTAVSGGLALGPDPEVFIYGLTVWAFGLAWTLMTRSGVLHPSGTGMVLGAAAMLVGAQMAIDDSGLSTAGVLLGLATAGLLAGVGIALREKLTIILGGIGIFWFIPQAMFHFFEEEIGVVFGLLVSGIALIGLATWFARHKEVL